MKWKQSVKHSPGDGTRDERNVKKFNLSTLFGLFFNNISVNRESTLLETLFTALLFSKIPSNRDGFIMGSCCVERFRLSFLIIETRGVLISGL